MGLKGLTLLGKTWAAGQPAAATADPVRRKCRAEPNPVAAVRPPVTPSRRLAPVRMAPSTFLWLIGGWAAALAVLAVVVVWLRSAS
jgi:hypothetical protein